MAEDNVGEVLREGDDGDTRDFAWPKSAQIGSLRPMDGKRSGGKALGRADAGYDGELGGLDRFRNNPSKRAQYSFVASEFERRGLVARPFEPAITFRALMILPPHRGRSRLLEDLLKILEVERDSLQQACEARFGRAAVQA